MIYAEVELSTDFANKSSFVFKLLGTGLTYIFAKRKF